MFHAVSVEIDGEACSSMLLARSDVSPKRDLHEDRPRGPRPGILWRECGMDVAAGTKLGTRIVWMAELDP
jgi:hypothetical protein